MTSPRDVLNRIRWQEGNERLAGVRIAYRHRGAPDDTAYLRGEDVETVGRSFMDLPDGARIPYHRVLWIEVRGRVEWQRGGPSESEEPNP